MVRVSWRQDAEVRTRGRQKALGPQWPTVEQPQAKMWQKCCYGRRRTWSQYSSLSPSPTHLSHTTNITLSRIKCERYIFIKKCIRSFIEVHILCLIMFLLIFVLQLYNSPIWKKMLFKLFYLTQWWDPKRNYSCIIILYLSSLTVDCSSLFHCLTLSHVLYWHE